jgi:hypothetical protein
MDLSQGVTLLLIGMLLTVLFFLLFFFIESPPAKVTKENTVLDDFLKKDN